MSNMLKWYAHVLRMKVTDGLSELPDRPKEEKEEEEDSK
jgi:hypothetical protein